MGCSVVLSHLDEIKTSGLASLAIIGDRIFEDINFDTIYSGRAALHSELLRISVDLLKKCSTHSERDVCSAVASFREGLEDLLNAIVVDPISLNNSDIVQDFVS